MRRVEKRLLRKRKRRFHEEQIKQVENLNAKKESE
jgi:hypothetical protein